MWKIQLFKLNYDWREVAAASSIVESGWLTMGERVIEFERRFGEMLGVGLADKVHCLATSNCTAALHMAVLAVGVQPGDEVIIPSLTFVADANVVKLAGAEPVLADCVSRLDLNPSAVDIERKITSRTRAVIIVHYGGYPCDMDAIVAVCRKHKLALIEDAAHAPGAAWKGRALGTFGNVGCFSFFSNKNLSIGEGGLICTLDPELSRKLGYLRSHGMTTLTLDRHQGRAYSYDVVQPGLNCRMDEIHAALGCVQLDKLPRANRRRGELTRRYRQRFKGTAISVPFQDAQEATAAYHIQPVLLPAHAERTRVMAAMKGEGIQTSIHYPPFWSFEAYRHFDPAATPVAASLIQSELTLPLYPTMTDDEVDTVADSLLRACSS
jgi:dTDP-4-amino-4,6-dideoxygalactose transaminase